MARTNTGKERASKSKPSQNSSSKKSKSKHTDDTLKEQVLALGGNQEDLELIKGVENAPDTGSSSQDPALAKDVSKFLKELNLGGSIVDSPKKSKRKGKEKGVEVEKKNKKDSKGKAKEIPKEKLQEGLHGNVKDTSSQNPSKKQKEKQTQKQKEKPKQKLTDAPQEQDRIPASTSSEPKVQLPTKVSLNPKSQFISTPTSQWYLSLPPLDFSELPKSNIIPDKLSMLMSKASDLHAADMKAYQTSSSSSSEASFLTKIIGSGTLSDRLSALTLLVQGSPVHNPKALENLKGMAERGKGKGGRDESLKALRCIVDWWVGGGAPDRKLKYFREQPLLHPDVTDQHLVVWYFEDWLKKYFFSVLQVLETLSLDNLPYVRTQTINLIFTLLRDKPEQEQNLLRLLVNKLGDTDRTLCSRASYHLLQLLQTHPSMKGIVVREIISLVLKPPPPPPSATPAPQNTRIKFGDDGSVAKPKPKPTEKKAINEHARYYATITFNQIVLTPADRDVALKLIDLYFELFKEVLGERRNDETEITEGAGNDEGEEAKVDKKGRIMERKKRGKGNKGQGKEKTTAGAAGFAEVEDEHSRLMTAILTGVNRALPFAKIDAGSAGINEHIDTLFLITHTSTFNISIQALVLIQQISSSLASNSSAVSKSIVDRYYRTLYVSLHDPRLANSSKQAMYLNLLFKSIKADAGNENGERIKAIVKRFTQVLTGGGSGATEFVAGGLYLLGELFSTIPGLRTLVTKGESHNGEPYDPKKRDPQYAHASSSALWELTPLIYHYHPAISLHARQLLNGQPLTATADLSQNTLSHFLDRFVYKNPKKLKPSEDARGAMQPSASAIEGIKLVKGEVTDGVLVNDKKFWKKNREEIPVDQLFFHQYFTQKEEKERKKAVKIGKRKGGESDEEGEDEEDDDEEEFAGVQDSDGDEAREKEAAGEGADDKDTDTEEAEIWKAMQATMPKAEGDDDLMEDSEDEDEDDLPSDLDEFDYEDSDEKEEEEEAGKVADESDGDDEIMSLVELSDNEDLVSLDGDVPDRLIEYDGPDASEVEGEEWDGIGGEDKKKRKREDMKGGRKKKLKSLPTFASYEDYAKMIEDGAENDI
ncbi:CBF/Mak21 family-domain-containing protein [Cyathus striatus]|nr:CBF/Mak21 family-domain-containing protein [Cyathus striatus]